jgi:hypothetical protein
MTTIQRFGVCLMFLAIYGCAVQAIPEGIADWEYGLLQLCLTFGMFLFMMFPKNKPND